MTGGGDAKAAEDDVRLAVLGLSGGAGDVGVPVDPEGLAVIVATLAVALGPVTGRLLFGRYRWSTAREEPVPYFLSLHVASFLQQAEMILESTL